jgi:hypothetical protein
MSKVRFTLNILAVTIFTLTVASVAQAQATRTWVSGVGDDVNPCSRTAPCKTFAGAISKTATNGEISVLDPAGFGALTITKSITVNGDGTLAGVLASLVNAFVINSSTAEVTLRNISINGAGNGLDAIRVLAASTVHIDSVNIEGFTGDGIDIALGAVGGTRVDVRNTTITECGGSGVLSGGTNTSANAISLDRVNIIRCGHGVRVSNRGIVAISNSFILANNATASSAGVLADSAVAGGAIIDVESTQINFNAVGVQANGGQTIRLSSCHMTANGNALNFAGGTIASFGNNRIAGNAAGENFASLTDIQQQ